MEPRQGARRRARTTAATGGLVVLAGLAVLGVLVHYSFTAEYGDVTDLTGGWRSRSSPGGALPLGLVVLAALVTVSVTTQRWVRLAAVAVPVLMAVALVAVTPVALQQKLERQYDDSPQCVDAAFEEAAGPGADAARESQQAFESVEHVGYFGGGGGSGVVGCDRPFLLLEAVDVLQHYRAVLPGAGWRVVEDDRRHLRAERDGMAFEVVVCGRGGVVWAGRADVSSGARCRPVY